MNKEDVYQHVSKYAIKNVEELKKKSPDDLLLDGAKLAYEYMLKKIAEDKMAPPGYTYYLEYELKGGTTHAFLNRDPRVPQIKKYKESNEYSRINSYFLIPEEVASMLSWSNL